MKIDADVKVLQFDLTFAVIATGKYYDYLMDLLSDIRKWFSQENVQVLVFTDQQRPDSKSGSMFVQHVQIPPEPWPEITLFRFNKILENKEKILGKYLVWTDADMRILKRFDIVDLMSGYNIRLSRHPGFSFNFRFAFENLFQDFASAKTYLHRIRTVMFQKISSHGWETCRESNAFTPISKRKTYVQGGFWIAEKEAALDMCKSIQYRIERDLELNYVPIYHDETYLNWFMSTQKPDLLPKDFVGAENYIWQDSKLHFVICVEK